MGIDAKTLVWPHEGNRAALAEYTGKPWPGGWVELEGGNDGQLLSRELRTAVIDWEISSSTDAITAALFLHGAKVRELFYSSDDGWAAFGRAAGCEDTAALKRLLATRRLLANHDGYTVLEALAGNGKAPKKTFLAAIADVPKVTTSPDWNFGGVDLALSGAGRVAVRGVGELEWNDVSERVTLDFDFGKTLPALTIDLGPLPSVWNDVGVFWGVEYVPTPFEPTAAQRRVMSDDAIDELIRLRAGQAKSRVRFASLRPLVEAVARRPLPALAARKTWEPWLGLPHFDGPAAEPVDSWVPHRGVHRRALGEAWQALEVPSPMFERVMRAVAGLRGSVAQAALGHEAIAALLGSWVSLGAPVDLVARELAVSQSRR